MYSWESLVHVLDVAGCDYKLVVCAYFQHTLAMDTGEFKLIHVRGNQSEVHRAHDQNVLVSLLSLFSLRSGYIYRAWMDQD